MKKHIEAIRLFPALPLMPRPLWENHKLSVSRSLDYVEIELRREPGDMPIIFALSTDDAKWLASKLTEIADTISEEEGP